MSHHLKMSVNRASTEHQQSVNRASTEHQQSVNRASTEHEQSINRASTERQQSWVLHHVKSKDYAPAYTDNKHISSFYAQKRNRHGHNPIVKMSVNKASTISGVASCIIQGLCCGF